MAGVSRFQDLDCHKLAVAVRREVLRLTRREVVRRDYRYLHQIRDSARGAPRNIAEGYARFGPTEILPFLNYAKASLAETLNHTVDGRENGYFTEAEAATVTSLIKRTIGAILRWMRYLESPKARAFYAKRRALDQKTDPAPRRQRPRPTRRTVNRIDAPGITNQKHDPKNPGT
jgi:four helix bundle protein